jgi:hypothetical protein
MEFGRRGVAGPGNMDRGDDADYNYYNATSASINPLYDTLLDLLGDQAFDQIVNTYVGKDSVNIKLRNALAAAARDRIPPGKGEFLDFVQEVMNDENIKGLSFDQGKLQFVQTLSITMQIIRDTEELRRRRPQGRGRKTRKQRRATFRKRRSIYRKRS